VLINISRPLMMVIDRVCCTQRHYSQLKDELQKLKQPSDDAVASDLVLPDTAVKHDPVSTDTSAAVTGSVPAGDEPDACLLPVSDSSSTTADTSSAAVTDAGADCDSVVSDSSSAPVA